MIYLIINLLSTNHILSSIQIYSLIITYFSSSFISHLLDHLFVSEIGTAYQFGFGFLHLQWPPLLYIPVMWVPLTTVWCRSLPQIAHTTNHIPISSTSRLTLLVVEVMSAYNFMYRSRSLLKPRASTCIRVGIGIGYQLQILLSTLITFI